VAGADDDYVIVERHATKIDADKLDAQTQQTHRGEQGGQ
jgi:hypothetical protein